MKTGPLFVGLLVTSGLIACNPAGPDSPSGSIESASSNYIKAVDFTGTYALDGNCKTLAGTVRVSETSMRLTDTVCSIKSAKGINTSMTEYVMTKCNSKGSPQADRTIRISEAADGLIKVTGWSDQTFLFQTCG